MKIEETNDNQEIANLSRREWLGLCGLFTLTSCFQMSNQIGFADKKANSIDVRANKAFDYMAGESDYINNKIIIFDTPNSGFPSYYPINWIGDVKDLLLDENHFDGTRTCIKLNYSAKGNLGWAGIVWACLSRKKCAWGDCNWGDERGLDLSGATKLILLARSDQNAIVEFSIGGINRPPYNDPNKPFQDSFGPIKVKKTLSKTWEEIIIPIPKGTNLREVIGGFAVSLSSLFLPQGCVIYLADIRYEKPNHSALHLNRSYSSDSTKLVNPAYRNSSFLYDNSLALLAWLARGDNKSLKRANQLGDALVCAQTNDRTFNDGRFRNAYSSGNLIDSATGKARLPGFYYTVSGTYLNNVYECKKPGETQTISSSPVKSCAKPEDVKKEVLAPDKDMWAEDKYTVSSDVGNAAWAILSLVTAHRILAKDQKDSPYLQAAVRGANWVEKFRVKNFFGGYSGGLEGWEKTPENPKDQTLIDWQSSEHNIDLYAAFLQLAFVTGDVKWRECAAHARKFVLAMWNEDKKDTDKHFWTGTHNREGCLNQDVIPLDVQVWALLAMGHDEEFRKRVGWYGLKRPQDFLAWTEKYCRMETSPGCPNVKGYRFSDKGTGSAWFEGSAQVAAAYQYLADTNRATTLLKEIAEANPADNSSYGIRAACGECAITGFNWDYPPLPHLGATAWFLLAYQGVNPYWMNMTALTPEK